MNLMKFKQLLILSHPYFLAFAKSRISSNTKKSLKLTRSSKKVKMIDIGLQEGANPTTRCNV